MTHRTITVFDGGLYDGDWPPENPDEFLGWFDVQIDKVPQECLYTALIELSSEDHVPVIRITYQRDETAEEEAARAADEGNRRTAHERAEREQLELLLEKYGRKE